MTWDVRKDTTNIQHSVHKIDFHTLYFCLLTLEYIFLFPYVQILWMMLMLWEVC